jgi:cytochrome c biogenesis protein CcmG/thiol:disulfide interchange protein DsbE
MDGNRVTIGRRLRILGLAACVAIFFFSACKSATTDTGGGGGGGTSITISGTITQGGVALAGVTVYLSYGASKTTTTGADGKYSFTGLDVGSNAGPLIRYIVTPSRAGTAFSPSNYEVVNSTKSDANFTASAASYGSEVGSIMANFTAKNQSGGTVNLSDRFGDVVLIDFTADWCVPCREKAEKAEAFYQKYKNRGFTYILIVIEGSPASWASTYGLTFPVLDDNTQKIYNMYRKSSIPLPHILDRNFTIRYKVEGFNQSEVEDMLNRLL